MILERVISWLFGPAEKKYPPIVDLVSQRWCDFDIVGESFYLENLNLIAGSPREPIGFHTLALLAPDLKNQHDSNAVAVAIENRIVGYLDSRSAKDFREEMKALGLENRVGRCTAYVSGGGINRDGEVWNIGVKLGVVWPLQVAETPHR